MTQNLYLGANLQPLFGKSGADLINEAAKAYAHVVQTNFPARAQAIAREIVQKSPDLVALQEVALWQTGPDPQHLQPGYDFLAILLQALADQGASYQAVAVNVNVSAALPIKLDLSEWASFTDRDAIIARSDLPVSQLKASDPTSQNFQAAITVPIGGQNLRVPRGSSTIDVKYRGKSYLFADTHLEAYSSEVRDLQAEELAGALLAQPLPVVLAGDINSLPDNLSGPYGILARAGFVDSWTQSMDGDPGNTAGQPDDLNCLLPSQIDHRVDYVLHDDDPYVDAVAGKGDIVGEEHSDCTNTDPPLWPSDHAGVSLVLHIASP